jgi:hypothetical protein
MIKKIPSLKTGSFSIPKSDLQIPVYLPLSHAPQ